MKKIKIIECPRDAMQGIKEFIPTQKKVRYIQSLLHVGFDTLDFGSFVSPKAIPQMQDTEAVLSQLDLRETKTKLLAIVANVRGAEQASKFEQITYLGYPFSISENFQMRNTGKTLSESIGVLKEVLDIASKTNKEVVIYLSMGFGNPYGDPWNSNMVEQWTEKLSKMGVRIISLSDTIGAANPEIIHQLLNTLIPRFPQIEFGVHLHTHPSGWYDKMEAAFSAGCTRFDGAIKGYGGCPMAKDELTGNMPTEKILSYFTTKKADLDINMMQFESAYNEMLTIF